jgi:hypothetical protein
MGRALVLPDDGRVTRGSAAYDPQTEDSPWEMDPQTSEWVLAPAWTWQGQPLYASADRSAMLEQFLVDLTDFYDRELR